MRDAKKTTRQTAIMAAAYEVLEVHGYAGASMLRIAKAAQASNETLYRWYGDKRGLFEAMVRANAAETHDVLTAAITDGDDPMNTLATLSPLFLRMILSDRAIALNRAAAADPTGELGAAIAAGGREQIGPLIAQLLSRLENAAGHPPDRLLDWYLGALLSDLQVRRIIGTRPVLTESEITARCTQAHRSFLHLLTMPPA